MQLWNDYEGRTIADVYPLDKLVRPEGRSAFFLTTNGTGTPAMVRVIEAHFDESEILNRWRMVSEIKQENLVALRKFGETELDGTPLVYAVMEPTEISLEELLHNRTLNVDEARQLATSMVGALQALHERNLIHGHIEPANILAAGEVVKLRSDCVREVVTDPESDAGTVSEQKARDAHALAIVLLQALTGRRSLQGSATLLPTPFDGIIRNGLSGKWGLHEMANALGPVKPAQVAAAVSRPQTPAPVGVSKPASPVAPAAAKPEEKPAVVSEAKVAAAPEVKSAASIPAPVAPKPSPVPTPQTMASAPKPVAEPVQRPVAAAPAPAPKPAVPVQAPDVRHRIVRPVEPDPRRNRLWIACGVGLLVLLLFIWKMTRTEKPSGANAASHPISTLASPQPADAPTTPTSTKPSAAGKPTSAVGAKRGTAPVTNTNAASNQPAAAGGRAQWRVIAYTYNRQEQAQQKADSLAKSHPGLSPEVFTPSGHAPYLVTVGGIMTRDQAEAFKQKARSAGLPHDIYAQNYTR